MKPGGYDVVWSDKDRRREKRLQTHWNTPVYHEGYVYGSSGRHSNEAELRCVELRTGNVMWTKPGLTRSSLLYVDGHFVVLAEGGELLLIKATPERFEPVAFAVLEAPPDGASTRRGAAQATDVSGLGGADRVARSAVRARARPAGVFGADPGGVSPHPFSRSD